MSIDTQNIPPEPFDPEKERNALFGLTEESSPEDRKRVIFEACAKTRVFSVVTRSVHTGMPHSRLLSFYLLPDGNLYFGTARGKSGYEDMKADPRVTLTGTFYEGERLRAYGIKINATVEKATDPDMIAEYWRINPGTKKMYIKGPELFEVMVLARGEGEFSHVYTAGHIARIRFGFGGEEPSPPRYSIDASACTQCGACAEACLTGTIRRTEKGQYYIRYTDCLECGKCGEVCPSPGAVRIFCDGLDMPYKK
ncbi:MAG: 4Fe-4S dicluster domain-containing protein [Clostridium sp.]|nr:4Fe-4S dicluster domain-containing protein [Clostridium sp.]